MNVLHMDSFLTDAVKKFVTVENFTEEEEKLIIENSSIVHYAKKDLLFREGVELDNYSIVVSGVICYLSNKNNKEHTYGFSFSGQFVRSARATEESNISVFTAICLSETVILNTKAHIINKLLVKSLAMNRAFLRILSQFYVADKFRLYSFLLDDIGDRYINFINTLPEEVIRQIPQKYIAGYIGTSPEHLSRIKNGRKNGAYAS